TEIKAVSLAYPWRGQLLLSDAPFSPTRQASGSPAPGEVWVDTRLAGLLALQAGDRIRLGERDLTVAAFLRQEPDRGGDLFSIAPRLLMNVQDVASTRLIQFGSHVSYHLLAAGEIGMVDGLRGWLKPRLKPGERVETVRDARPEIRSVLDKARQFLGLAAMASVVLAMVAMALAALRFVQRNLDVCAMMRCFGATQSDILRAFALQMALLGLLGGLLGCALGYAAQAVLGELAGRFFLEQLPVPGWMPLLYAMAVGLATLFGVVTPHLLRLRNVPALRILRRDLGEVSPWGIAAWMPGVSVAVTLIFAHAGEARLGWMTLLGFCGILLAAGIAGALMTALLRRCDFSGAWRLGLANLSRRPLLGIAQVTGFSLALMALLLLTVVRADLFADWRATLPPDAPNRFVINIQPEQIASLRTFFRDEHMPEPVLFPMIRGRLVAINGQPLDPSRYADERARRLVEREFNLSWARELQADNRIVAGRWWRQGDAGRPLLSLEQGIAETLGIRLGDKLTYEIAGERAELTVASLRKVEWDSMRANFFAVAAPGTLERFPASYITSFHLPAEKEEMLNRLVRAFSNLTIIDVAAIMQQVRAIMDKMAYAVEFVFLFCLASGLAVLYAALAATHDERATETALLRVLGAGRAQVRNALLAEFALLGLLAGLLATAGASALGYYLGVHVLNVPYVFDPMLPAWGLGVSTLLIPAAAWLKLRSILAKPPRDVLQSA
ncbi:MAG: FtsX-like permease family protein, partial [Nitrosomonadales bacterium]